MSWVSPKNSPSALTKQPWFGSVENGEENLQYFDHFRISFWLVDEPLFPMERVGRRKNEAQSLNKWWTFKFPKKVLNPPKGTRRTFNGYHGS